MRCCLNRFAAAAFLFVLAGVAFGQMKSDEPVKTVRISGRLVSPEGNPASFAVRISKMERDGPPNEITAISDGHGLFTFLAESHHKYRIWLGAGMKTAPKTVDTTSGTDIDVGDMIFEYCPAANFSIPKPPLSQPQLVGDLKSEQILIEPQTFMEKQWRGIGGPLSLPSQAPLSNSMEEGPQCWSGPSLDRRAEWEAFPMVSFDHYLSIESFVGGKVKSVRVVRYDPKLTHVQIKEEVRRVWLGVFWYAASNIGWDEATFWNIEASVEYEDGKRSSILMDGMHVQVQDQEGKYWFIREWPAVQ
jgi:hypothetical protein